MARQKLLARKGEMSVRSKINKQSEDFTDKEEIFFNWESSQSDFPK